MDQKVKEAIKLKNDYTYTRLIHHKWEYYFHSNTVLKIYQKRLKHT